MFDDRLERGVHLEGGPTQNLVKIVSLSDRPPHELIWAESITIDAN
jgi:hypothetical protein